MNGKLYSAFGGLILLAGLVPAQPVQAMDVRTGRQVTIGPDELVEDDLYVFGETVTIEGTVIGDVMASGLRVVLLGEVTGDLSGCAQTFVIDGKVGDDVRVAGMVLSLGSESRVGDDVMSAGLSLESAAGSSVGGSLGFLGYRARLAGDVAQDLGVSAVGAELLGSVGGDVDVEVESEAPPGGLGVVILGVVRGLLVGAAGLAAIFLVFGLLGVLWLRARGRRAASRAPGPAVESGDGAAYGSSR